MQTALIYLGKILFGGYFLMGAYSHFSNLGMMSGYAQSKGVPAAKLAVLGSGLLLLAGGISIIFNLYPLIGLGALVLFLLPVTFMMHAFWKVQDPQARMGEMINFMKNIALLGAVVMFLSAYVR
jgi:putative oxidoreductase